MPSSVEEALRPYFLGAHFFFFRNSRLSDAELLQRAEEMARAEEFTHSYFITQDQRFPEDSGHNPDLHIVRVIVVPGITKGKSFVRIVESVCLFVANDQDPPSV